MDDEMDRTPGVRDEPAEHPPWPAPGEHLWSKWHAHAPRKGGNPPTQHRKCEHPECTASEVRVAPVG